MSELSGECFLTEKAAEQRKSNISGCLYLKKGCVAGLLLDMPQCCGIKAYGSFTKRKSVWRLNRPGIVTCALSRSLATKAIHRWDRWQ